MSDLIRVNREVGLTYTPEQVQLIKNTICKDSTDDELKYFLYVASKTGLDPFTKQIYSIARKDHKSGKTTRTIQTSIDGFRVIAERSGKYAGQLGPYWCGDDGQWLEVWVSRDLPVAAKVGVLRSGFKEPLWAVALFASYKQEYAGKLSTFWGKFPDLMIAKVAESLALRKAFPQDLSGIYTSEEMAQTAQEHREPVEAKVTIEAPAAPQLIATLKAKEILINLCKVACKDMSATEKTKFITGVLGIPSFKDLDRMQGPEILKIAERVEWQLQQEANKEDFDLVHLLVPPVITAPAAHKTVKDHTFTIGRPI